MLVATQSTTSGFYPCSGWMATTDIRKARPSVECRMKSNGDMRVQPAYQTCNVPTSVDNSVAIGSVITTDGVVYGSTFDDVSAGAVAKLLIRFGWNVWLTTGSTPSTALVGGKIEIEKP
jgi:hypothetical protein